MDPHDNYYDPEIKPHFNGFWWSVLAFIAVILSLFAIFSCSPVKRMGGIAAKHPDAARKMCIQMFPVDVKTVTKTEYIQGSTIYDTTMVYVDCDSVLAMAKDHGKDGKTMVQIKKVRVPCPINSIRVDTVEKTSVQTVTNTAKEQMLEKELMKASADSERFRKSRDTWRWAAIIAGLVLALGAILKIKNRL